MASARRIRTPAVVLAGVLALLGASCNDGGEVPVAAERPTTTTVPDRGNVDGALTIGGLIPFTGPLAALAPSMEAGIEMAKRDINAAAVELGTQPLTVIVADEGADPAQAITPVDRLLNVERVDAVIGPASSRTALAVLPALTRAGTLTCSPVNTAITLERFPDQGFYVRVAPTDRLQAVAMAQLIAEGGYRRVGLLYPHDDYGRGIAAVLTNGLNNEGTTVSASVAYGEDASSYGAEVDAVLATRPEAVAVVGVAATGVPVLRDLASRLGAPERPGRLPVFATDGLRVLSPPDPTTFAGVQVVAPNFRPRPAGSDEFVARLADFAPGVNVEFAAHSYDCAVILALAAEAAGTDDPARLAQEIVGVTRGGQPCNSFAFCAQNLSAGRNIDYQGVSGAIDLSDAGEATRGRFHVYVLGDGGELVIDETRPLEVNLSS